MKRTDKLIWLGGGFALGAMALRASVLRASRPSSLVVDEVLSKPREAKAGSVSSPFDSLFSRHGRGIPVAYLRSLAKRESNLNPAERSGPAWGLLQVIEVVRRDYNERHGTRFRRLDLLEPKTNIVIASDLLRRIIASYARNHPSVPNMQQRWNNRRFVELLTFGWNAGYSERGGVGRVARYLEGRGQGSRIDIDSIHQSARAAGASRHLSNARKVAWSKGVAWLYSRERQEEEIRP